MPPACCQMPRMLPGLDNAWEKCFEILKQIKDKPDSKEYKEMVHGKGNFYRSTLLSSTILRGIDSDQGLY